MAAGKTGWEAPGRPAAGGAGKPVPGAPAKPGAKPGAKTGAQGEGVTGVPEQDLPQLETLLRELAFKREKFLIGQERTPPEDIERKAQAIIRAYAVRPIQNAGLNFKYTTLVARSNALAAVWRRRLREREEGRGVGGALARAARAAQEEQRPKVHRPTLGAGRPGEYLASEPQHEQRRLAQFYEAYRAQREKAGEPVAKLSPEGFQKALADKIAQIKREQRCETVLVRVVSEQGKTRIVAKPFRAAAGPGDTER